jgi:hypothetical protein
MHSFHNEVILSPSVACGELLGAFLVTPRLDQDVQHAPVLIHVAQEIMTLAADGQTHLVQVPCIPRSRTSASELIGIRLPELHTPLTDRFVGHHDPTSEQQLLDIAVAQAETAVQPTAVGDNFRRETMALVEISRR